MKHSAWVLGGADPSSGTATQYELLRGLSELLKKGWKPLRTIIIASWDAEEFGLVGSTEWVEDFGEWLQAHCRFHPHTCVELIVSQLPHTST